MTAAPPADPSAPNVYNLIATEVQNGGKYVRYFKEVYVENEFGIPDLLNKVGNHVITELHNRGVKVQSVNHACNRCVAWGFRVRHEGPHDQHALRFVVVVDAPMAAHVVAEPVEEEDVRLAPPEVLPESSMRAMMSVGKSRNCCVM